MASRGASAWTRLVEQVVVPVIVGFAPEAKSRLSARARRWVPMRARGHSYGRYTPTVSLLQGRSSGLLCSGTGAKGVARKQHGKKSYQHNKGTLTLWPRCSELSLAPGSCSGVVSVAEPLEVRAK